MLNTSIATALNRRVQHTTANPGWILERTTPGASDTVTASPPIGRLSGRVWKLLGVGPVNQAYRSATDGNLVAAFDDGVGVRANANLLASTWTAARALPLASDSLPGVPATRWLLQR